MEIAVLSILILLNGFFALSEIALVSCKRSRLEQRKLNGNNGARIALLLLDDAENFLSAIQVGITLIGIVTGVYGGMSIADDLAPFFMQFEITVAYAPQIALSATVIVITFFSIVVGELVPKTIALNNPDAIAVLVAPVIYYFSTTFFPFVRLLSLSTYLINRLIGIKKRPDLITEEELRQLIRNASTEGVINKEQNALHENVFYFADKKAKHIMTHRTDVKWIDIDKSQADIHNQLMQVQHNKIICCNGSLDRFKGILELRDYFKMVASGQHIRIDLLITEPLIVPANVDAQTVLSIMRQRVTHICCVVNEYGGFEGLITLHDIIENIVGQIPDEGESCEPDVFIRDDQSVLVNGDAPIETLTDIIEDFTVDFDKIDYSTVAGFVFKHIDKIPQLGDTFVFSGYEIEIIDINDRKIDKVLITRLES